MGDWLLIILVVGVGGVSEPQLHRVTEAQCRGVLEAIEPVQKRLRIGASCISPDGRVIEDTTQ